MQLPIDASNVPAKDKYLDEETEVLAIWYEFGKGDVASPFGDVFTKCSPKQVDALVALREKFCTDLLRVLRDR